MVELRARIGDPESELAIQQGCTCKENKDSCLVHSDVDAYVIEYEYMGRKKMLGKVHPNSFIIIPIKHELKFIKDSYQAANEWHASHKLLRISLYMKEGRNELRPPTKEERDSLMYRIEMELAGM